MKQNLVLFDLDNTLIPMDSDYQWANFLSQTGRAGINPEEAKLQNELIMERYNKGKLTAEESAEFMLGFLSRNTAYDLAIWHEEFMRTIIRPSITNSALKLVRTHLETGAMCAIVTSTNHFITAPIARAFGIQNLIATIPHFLNGRYTGKIHGIPSFREGKVQRVTRWLNTLGYSLRDFPASYFYTDSVNDIPLLEIVSHPIATNPSLTLREIAISNRWQILDLFENNKKDL